MAKKKVYAATPSVVLVRAHCTKSNSASREDGTTAVTSAPPTISTKNANDSTSKMVHDFFCASMPTERAPLARLSTPEPSRMLSKHDRDFKIFFRRRTRFTPRRRDPMVVEEGDDDPADDHTLQSPKSSLLTGQELNSSAGQRRLDSSVPTMEPLSLDAPSDEVALAAGGTVDIWRWRNAGYLAQYAVVGFIYHGLPATIYGVFLGYLGVPSYVYATAVQVVTLPWAFKFVFGMMNDCVPLWGGYRRKPYMCIGWAMCCLTLVAMSMLELPPPYWCRGADGSFITKQLHPNGTLVLDAAGSAMMAKPCNPRARDFGGTLALWMALAACGYVVADVAADGLTVEYARREPLAQRGTTQSTVYLVRTCGSIAAIMLVGFGMNGKEYNGTFDWTLSFPQICLCFSVPCAAMIPASWFLVEDTPVGASGGRLHTFAEYRTKCWTLLQSKAMFYVVMYSFLSAAFGTISTTAQGNVTKWWAGVKNLQSQIFSMLGLGLFAAGLWLVKKRFLNASWRKMLGFTTLFLNAVDAVFAFCTIFDVVRNQYFYLGETVLIMVPEAAQFLVTTFVRAPSPRCRRPRPRASPPAACLAACKLAQTRADRPCSDPPCARIDHCRDGGQWQ